VSVLLHEANAIYIYMVALAVLEL